jgi:hypothetical protein
MTGQQCLDYITKYRQESVTKYDFFLQSYAVDSTENSCYASLHFALRDDHVEILEAGRTIQEALNNLVNYLKHPSNQHYRTTNFTLPEYNHDH